MDFVSKKSSLLFPRAVTLRGFLQVLILVLADLIGLILAIGVVDSLVDASIFGRFKQLGVVFVVFLFFQVRAGQYSRRRPFWDDLRKTLQICIVMLFIDAALVTISGKGSEFLWPIWILAMIILPLCRYLAKAMMLNFSMLQHRVVIVGDGVNATETALALLCEPLMGYEIIGFLSPDEHESTGVTIKGTSYSVIRLSDNPEEQLEAIGNPHIIIALEHDDLDHFGGQIDKLNLICPKLSIVPALRGLPLLGMDVDSYFSHEVLMMNIRNNLSRPLFRLQKRLFDIVGSTILLFLLSPLFILVYCKVRKSGAQVFFGHERIGQNGVPFKCYKFRSMVLNAQDVLQDLLANDSAAREEWGKEFKLKNDPRITPIGHFLRKTSLDELPQLWNVLKGDMSLVGPRPVIAEEVLRYGDKSQHYLQCKPGMTGLWQVSGRNDIDYENRVYLDAWYVKNWTLWNDIVILVKTVAVVVRRDGAY
ncbi:undecaprenyl-phosphate galactose phosphotransferase WbaP [Amphritea opalescens]|uniref:undecaprenyl-phosphate galactose phosphotransferase WbaP n=1 Tax=Amphritea opalescens TaxID=2490544 RepID=UPI0019D3170D|nr:undecaprenyl-phosphate galactose phosphotransferase WbaP [Amphritea opalescens]